MKPYYEDDFCTIYHGDCREVDAWLAADVLVTDPPYGIDYNSGRSGLLPRSIEGDKGAALRDEVLAAWGERPALIFGAWKVERPTRTRMVLTWCKGLNAGMGDLALPWKPNTEEVYVIGSGFAGHRGSSVLDYQAPVSQASWGRCHPTEKPVALMRDLLAKCPPGVVADPFMGSGTTLRAAKDLGRKAIGVELDERYCEVAAKRLAQEVLAL